MLTAERKSLRKETADAESDRGKSVIDRNLARISLCWSVSLYIEIGGRALVGAVAESATWHGIDHFPSSAAVRDS